MTNNPFKPSSAKGGNFCINHPSIPMAGKCETCGNSICPNCMSEFEGNYCCPACRQAGLGPDGSPKPRQILPDEKHPLEGVWAMSLLLLKLLPICLALFALGYYMYDHMNPQGGICWSRAYINDSDTDKIAVLNDKISFASSQSTITAVDKKWGLNRCSISPSEPESILNIHKVYSNVFLYQTPDTIHCVRESRNKLITAWTYELKGSNIKISGANSETIIIKEEIRTFPSPTEPAHSTFQFTCLDSLSGTEKWHTNKFSQTYQYAEYGNKIYIMGELRKNPGQPLLFEIQRQTGRIQWKLAAPWAENTMIYPHANGIIAAAKHSIYDIDANGQIAWEYELSNDFVSFAAGDASYFAYAGAHDHITVLDMETHMVMWSKKIGRLHSPITIDRNKLLFISEREKDYRAFKFTDFPINLTPNKKMYYTLFCVDKFTGKTLWQTQNVYGHIVSKGSTLLVWANLDEIPLAYDAETKYNSFCYNIDIKTGKVKWLKFFKGSFLDAEFSKNQLFVTQRIDPSMPERKQLTCITTQKTFMPSFCAFVMKIVYYLADTAGITI